MERCLLGEHGFIGRATKGSLTRPEPGQAPSRKGCFRAPNSDSAATAMGRPQQFGRGRRGAGMLRIAVACGQMTPHPAAGLASGRMPAGTCRWREEDSGEAKPSRPAAEG